MGSIVLKGIYWAFGVARLVVCLSGVNYYLKLATRIAMPAAPDPERTATVDQAIADADSKTQITVCTWNIYGTARANLRKKVTTATFKHNYTDGKRLRKSDIICVQEMIANPAGPIARKYLPQASRYHVVKSKQPRTNIYNAVYYNKKKSLAKFL